MASRVKVKQVHHGPFLLATLLVALPVSAQSIDPTQPHRTITTEHFRVTYPHALESLAIEAARIAEAAWTTLGTHVGAPPGGTVDLLLSDASDITNGFAMAVPSNRITVFVNPPVEDLGLQNFRDWLDLVITHELAHIFHMEATGAFGRFVRGIFGRLPLGWPVFPVGSMPSWAREGLAVEMESLTGAGRLHGSYHEMIVRTAVLEDAVDRIDRVSHDSPKWPGGQRAYIYGSLFLDYISRTYGADARAAIVRKTGGTVLPPELALNLIGKQATGKSFTTLWREWNDELSRTYAPLFDSLRAIGVTETEAVAGSGRIARHPRISRDGRFLAFAEETGSEVAHTRVIEIATGRTAWKQRRTGIAASSWMHDGALLTSQVQFNNAYRTFADLYQVTHDDEDRLTNAERLQDPDISRAGNRIVAVQNEAGATRLVLLSPDGGAHRPITGYHSNVQWSQPRWSPDDSRIAVAQWRNGNQDIVVIDTTGREHARFSDDAAIDAAPAWSPDGRYVLFWSDRTGIPNIFAVDVARSPAPSPNDAAAPAMLQVTNVLTGAYDPEVSPDARHLYISVYHADGFRIERTPYNPATWRPVLPVSIAQSIAVRASQLTAIRASQPTAVRATQPAAVPASQPERYSALHTLRPYYWLPLAFDVEHAGTFIGAMTSGRDLLGRHSYNASVAIDPANGRSAGSIAYTRIATGRTAFGGYLARDWDYLGRFRAIRQNGDTSVVNGIEREDVAQATTSFLHRRMRSAANFTIGAEYVRRHRFVADSTHIRFTNARDALWGPIARIAFTNTRTPAHAISPENGVSLQVAGRMRFDHAADNDRGYTELTTWNTAYRSLDFGGFAHHVIAARFSALLRNGDGAAPGNIGGVPGAPLDLGITAIGDNAGLLPVRGFAEGDRYGTRAWTASIEYRLPLAFPARGLGTWPVFLDRISAAAFADAGNASCTDQVAELFVCPSGPDPLTSVGLELSADIALGFVPPFRTRVGLAQPLTGPRSGPRSGARAYAAFGHSF